MRAGEALGVECASAFGSVSRGYCLFDDQDMPLVVKLVWVVDDQKVTHLIVDAIAQDNDVGRCYCIMRVVTEVIDGRSMRARLELRCFKVVSIKSLERALTRWWGTDIDLPDPS